MKKYSKNRVPLISVIIPVYNGEKTIKRAIDSVLLQDHKNIELIVIDDCSTDNTHQILSSIVDPRLKVIRHEVNKERSAARNTGLQVAKGEYIAFIDDDDAWLPSKLEEQLKYLKSKNNAEWRAVVSDYNFYNGKKWKVVSNRVEGDLFKEVLCVEVSLGVGSTLLMHRSVLNEIGYFNEDHSRNEDLEYILRYLKKYKLAVLNIPLVDIYGHRSIPIPSQVLKAKLHFFKYFSNEIKLLHQKDQRKVLARQWLQLSKSYAECADIANTLRYYFKSLSYTILMSNRFKVFPFEGYLSIPVYLGVAIVRKLLRK